MDLFYRYLKNCNWFYISLLIFIAVLPFSEALVSITSGMVLFVALTEDKAKNKRMRFRKNLVLLTIPAIFFVFLISALLFGNIDEALYDIKKNLFFLVLPPAFMIGKEISSRQKQFLFVIFSFAVMIATFVAFYRWWNTCLANGDDVRQITLISHIRFSFQLIVAFWFCLLTVQKNYTSVNKIVTVSFIILGIYFFSFTLFQHSLTGLFALAATILFFIFYSVFRAGSKYKMILLTAATLVVLIPVGYVSWIVYEFYDIEKIDITTIDKKTPGGNNYAHYFDEPLVENGRYVYLYVCEEELREEWNKISEFKYDSIGRNGFPVHSTLLRYLTSRGLRKDAGGVKSLSGEDVKNIEKGIANIIYSKRKLSLYPRIYESVWEYYIYTKTGYANDQSLSQRIEFAKAAFTIIRHNFWFGVGTGNWRDEFVNAYQENKSGLGEKYYASSHNQYLNYLVKFGITGFLMILFFLTYPVVRTKRYNDPYFLIFLVLIIFSNFADSNLESHMGSSFFVFFYCLFLITDGIDYLRLK